MKIGIVGLGFVGLTFASVLANKGYNVIGVDSDKIKIKNIKSGKSPFYEPQLDNILKNALTKKLILSENIEEIVNECDFIFLTLGTPIDKNGNINLKIILKVSKKMLSTQLINHARHVQEVVLQKALNQKSVTTVVEKVKLDLIKDFLQYNKLVLTVVAMER